MVDPAADKMAGQLDEDGVVGARRGTSPRQVPPDGHVSTAEAAEMLGVTSSYVRQLIRNRSVGATPYLSARQVVTNGGRELLYVNRRDVIELRNTGAVRPRRNKVGTPPSTTVNQSTIDQTIIGPTGIDRSTVNLTGPQGDSSTTHADLMVAQDQPPVSVRDLEPNWELELELATANARLGELQERVNVLEALNGQLETRYQEIRARLRELARAQMQLLEGYAGDQDSN